MRSLRSHELAWAFTVGVFVLILAGIWWASLAIIVVMVSMSALYS